MGGPDAQHEALDGPAAPEAGLAGPLVDLEMILHLAVSFGGRVVVDGRAASLDPFREDRPQMRVQRAFIGRAQARRAPEWMELREPQGLVGVDVADARQERLVDEQRLEAGASPPDELPEYWQRE